MQFSLEGLECETSTILILGLGERKGGVSVLISGRGWGPPSGGILENGRGVWRADRRRGRGIFCPVTGAAKCQTPHAAEEERRPLKRLVFFIRICSGCGGARNRNQELSLVRLGESVKNYLADFFG